MPWGPSRAGGTGACGFCDWGRAASGIAAAGAGRVLSAWSDPTGAGSPSVCGSALAAVLPAVGRSGAFGVPGITVAAGVSSVGGVTVCTGMATVGWSSSGAGRPSALSASATARRSARSAAARAASCGAPARDGVGSGPAGRGAGPRPLPGAHSQQARARPFPGACRFRQVRRRAARWPVGPPPVPWLDRDPVPEPFPPPRPSARSCPQWPPPGVGPPVRAGRR